MPLHVRKGVDTFRRRARRPSTNRDHFDGRAVACVAVASAVRRREIIDHRDRQLVALTHVPAVVGEIDLGMVYQRAFRLEDHVMPAMRTLAARTRESVSFYTHEGATRVCLFRIDSPLSVRENHNRVGDVAPVSRGAAGRAYSAFRDGAAKAKPEDLRAAPFVDVGGVFPELGNAVAPVFGIEGAFVGLLMVSGPKERFTPGAIARIRKALRSAARAITAELGG